MTWAKKRNGWVSNFLRRQRWSTETDGESFSSACNKDVRASVSGSCGIYSQGLCSLAGAQRTLTTDRSNNGFRNVFACSEIPSSTTVSLYRCRRFFFVTCHGGGGIAVAKETSFLQLTEFSPQGQKMHKEKYLSPRVAPEQTKKRVSPVSFRLPAPASNVEVLANAIFASSKVRFSRTDASAEQGSARQNRITYACLSAVFLFCPVNVRSGGALKALLCRLPKAQARSFSCLDCSHKKPSFSSRWRIPTMADA